MIRVPRLLLLLLLLSSCALMGRADSPIGMTLPELLQRIEAGEPVLNRLPEPTETTISQQQNIHAPLQIDTIRRLAYPGLLLTVYEPGASAKQMITEVIVTEPGYRTTEGIQVGSSLQALSDAYGEADFLEGDEYVYQAHDAMPASVRFRVQEERITRMQWEFYVD